MEADNNNSSSLMKMLSVMDLFTVERSIWATIELIDALGTSRSTGYRYIRTLSSAGFLVAVGNGSYTLGPRIIELDLQIRKTDPLLQASREVMDQLVDKTGHSVLLCTLFQSSVICIDERRAPLGPQNLFTRGQRRPLFRGAISKVILANLPHHRLRTIFARRKDDIVSANLGESWADFRKILTDIRSEGFAASHGEFNPGIVGIAAPIMNLDKAIIGAVGIAFSSEELRHSDLQQLSVLVKRAAWEIARRMTDAPGIALPPRAVG